MKLFITKATTSKTQLIFIQDSSSTTGAGLTGLVWNTASLSWFYYREAQGTGGTAVTLATQTLGTWATGGFIEVDAADMPGWYEIGVPDAVLATGVDFVGMQLKGATNMAPVNIEIQLTDFDVNNAAPDANVTKWLGTAAATPTVAGVPEVDLTHVMGTILTEGGAGRLAAAIIKLFDVATPTLVASDVMRGTDSAALASLFTGMTSVPEWIGLILGKQAGDATALTESKATGAGSGTYDPTTDSVEALRDRGDAAWTTGAGTGLTPLASGTAQSGTASTVVLASGEAFADDVLNGNVVKITAGTGAGQARVIISNTLADDTCNVYPNWTTNPGADSVYEIIEGSVNVSAVSLDGAAADNLESACDNYSVTRGLTGTALPAAAADGVGGVPISDAGALDMDNRMPSAAAVTNLNTLYDGVEGFFGAYAGPRGPGVYLNDAAANTSTANGVDGTIANPVSTIAAAKTLADSMSLDRIYLVNDSTITLAATMEDYEFVGIGEMSANSINLGTQDVDNSEFWNVLITGAQGGTGRLQATGCVLSVITGMEITALKCLIANAGSLTLRDDCAFDSCFSAVAGASTPTLNINSVASVNVYFRHYSGGLTVDNAVATTVMSFDCPAGQLIIDATCTSLTVVPRGNCKITDNGTTTSIDAEAAINRSGVADVVWDEVLTGATHNIASSAGRRLRALQDFGLYEGGAVWINTVSGTAGTVDFENGTVNNPVDNIADALTIAASVGLVIFHVEPGSSFTLGASVAGKEFIGFSYTVALNGQSISGTLFQGATITGNDAGTNAVMAHFHECKMSGTSTLGMHMMRRSELGGDIVLAQATDYFWESCFTGVAGSGTPSVDFESAVEVKNLVIAHYHGGMEFKNLGAGGGTHAVSLMGNGQLIYNVNCAGGTMSRRGHWKLTDNAGGAVTETLDDNTVNIAQTSTAVGTDGTGLVEAGGDGDHLTAINLPNQTMDIVGNITGNLSGSVGSVTGAVGSVAGNVDGNVTGSVGSLAAQAKLDVNAEADTALTDYAGPTKAEMDTAHALLATPAQVNTEVSDVLKTDTVTLPGQGAPTVTPTMEAILAWLYKNFRNRKKQNATEWDLYADDQTTVDSKATVSDDGTDAIKQEIASGP